MTTNLEGHQSISNFGIIRVQQPHLLYNMTQYVVHSECGCLMMMMNWTLANNKKSYIVYYINLRCPVKTLFNNNNKKA